MNDYMPGSLSFLAKLCQSNSDAVSYDINEEPDVLFNLAIQHGVTGLIAHNSNLPKADGFTSFFQKMDSYNTHKTIAANFFDAEATKMLKLLVQQNIQFVVLKGFALARTIYPIPAMRTKADVDILIQPQDVEKVKSLFTEAGYHNPRGWEPKAIINQFTQRKVLTDKLNVDFDIHLKISNNKRLENILSLNALLGKSELDTNTNIRLVGKVHALLHAIFHLINHRSQGDLIKLIWFYDIYLLSEKLSEQEQLEFCQLVNESGLSKVTIKTLKLTDDYFDGNVIHQIINKINTDSAAVEFDSLLTINDKSTLFAETFASHKSLKDKWLFVKETVFPPPAEIYAKYGKQNKQPLVWLYLRRIVGGLKKHFRKADKSR